MPQSLTQLPQYVEFEIGACVVKIHDHRVVYLGGLFARIRCVINNEFSHRAMLQQFEKYGVSYEAAIECCAVELEQNAEILAYLIGPEMLVDTQKTLGIRPAISMKNGWELILDFSESEAGRAIAGQYIDKIRSCDDWGELYDELHVSSRFQKEMENRIKKEVKQQCRKV